MPQTRTGFHEELRKLEHQALGGLDLVNDALGRSLKALSEQDVQLAAMIVADDDRIDGRYLEVQQGVLSLLATQAPVAGDLRIVAALLHVIRCVERMGDQCVNIAKLIPLSGHAPPKDGVIDDAVQRMGRLAQSQVTQARDAFDLRDTGLAHGLVGQDRELNRLNRDVFQRAVDIGDDAGLREWAMFMVLAARALERVGDNAVDIGEQVVFVVSGLFRELSGASRSEEAAGSSGPAEPPLGGQS